MIQRIRISGEYYTLIDEQDILFVSMWQWHCIKQSSGLYVRRSEYNKKILLHNEIVTQRMNLIIPNGYEVDHINRDTLDNTRNNLRIVTYSEQQFNRKTNENNTTGYRGIYWENQTQKWKAVIMINKKYINLGRFINIEDAIAARQEAELKYLGEIIQ